ncbi:MAG: hypothetical protein JWP94_920 [Mucilaginibacter sp.]|nr:hypothetical protein [Mucilaginibacter sp.]
MKKLYLLTLFCTVALRALSQETNNDTQWESYPKGETSTYRATVLNSSFTVPLIRFNRVDGDNTKKGNVSFFNSIGAGFGISWGRLDVTTDNSAKANVINTEMNNTFGIQIGCLFASNNTNGGNQQNIFAPTLSFSVLNFQFGYGCELGTVVDNQKRGFVTIAYSIPLAKFIKGGFYILRRSKKSLDQNSQRFEAR